MKMKNRRQVLNNLVRKSRLVVPENQAQENADTAARVKAVLAQVSQKEFTVLATFKASKGPDHEIRMGKNGAVFCTGKCWQYSKTGTCKHLDYFRAHCKTQAFPRIEK